MYTFPGVPIRTRNFPLPEDYSAAPTCSRNCTNIRPTLYLGLVPWTGELIYSASHPSSTYIPLVNNTVICSTSSLPTVLHVPLRWMQPRLSVENHHRGRTLHKRIQTTIHHSTVVPWSFIVLIHVRHLIHTTITCHQLASLSKNAHTQIEH